MIFYLHPNSLQPSTKNYYKPLNYKCKVILWPVKDESVTLPKSTLKWPFPLGKKGNNKNNNNNKNTKQTLLHPTAKINNETSKHITDK